MKTNKIVNYYQVNPDGKWNRNLIAKERKEFLRKNAEERAIAKAHPIMIREVFEVIDGEIDSLRKFFEGAVTDYYHAQSRETPMFTSSELTYDRNSMLKEAFGYVIPMPGGKTKQYRQSTTEWRGVQDWNDRLAVIKETLFDPNDWVFPDSEMFWKLAKRIGDEDKTREAFRIKIVEMNERKLGLDEREKEMKELSETLEVDSGKSFVQELEEAGNQVECEDCERDSYFLVKAYPKKLGKEIGDYYDNEFGTNFKELIEKGIIGKEECHKCGGTGYVAPNKK